jgi:hypothetical protein
MRGEAPYDIEFRWVYAPPMPFGLDAEARRAMVRKRVEEVLAGQAWGASGVVRDPDIARPGRDIRSTEKRRASPSVVDEDDEDDQDDEPGPRGVPTGTESS